MNPNTTLQKIHELTLVVPRSVPEVDELVVTFEDLDRWLSGGGLLPNAWILAITTELKQGVGET